jgi:ubiquinone/menaquinone biosynthesis C-methylase UbiE
LERVFFCPAREIEWRAHSSADHLPPAHLRYTQAMNEDRNILAEWSESAPYWERHAAEVRQLFAPISAALIRAAHISAGRRVLDVAGGAGEPSLEIAAAVAPQGRVVCTDAVAEMVAAAERLARRQGVRNIEFKICAANSLPFEDESFDAAVSRLGAMFFEDVAAALAEMLRVIRPAGNIALAVWGERARNPFFSIVTDVMARYIPPPPEDEAAPGAFRFAGRGKLLRLLEQAGAADVREQVVDFQMEAALTPAEFWRLRSELSDSLRAKVARLTGGELAQVVDEVERRVAAFFSEGRLSLPAQVLIVSGNRPAP